ncbi:MATE family efflux transporter, partial [Alistipes putredinis]|uniref:MATE family efflux transporter n=1 Tax=Alistipes putredinis TaxID=28117 RepID=UPI00210CB477
RFIGARDEESLRRCLGRCLGWGSLISVLFVVIYLIWWRDLLGIFIQAGTPDAAQVVSTAGTYIVWIILIPLASAM